MKLVSPRHIHDWCWRRFFSLLTIHLLVGTGDPLRSRCRCGRRQAARRYRPPVHGHQRGRQLQLWVRQPCNYKSRLVPKWLLKNAFPRPSYESADGKREVVTGFNKQIDAENKGMSMRGTYSWVEAGVTYTVNWVADENGFQPEGAHLPVAPVAWNRWKDTCFQTPALPIFLDAIPLL